MYYVSILTLCPYVLNMARRRKVEVGRPKLEDACLGMRSVTREDRSLKMRTSGLVII